jgi:ketosteroid isomerase-like protein
MQDVPGRRTAAKASATLWSSIMQRFTLPLLAVLTAVGSSATTSVDETARMDIMRAVEQFRQAFASGNIEGIEEYYSDDLLKFRAGVPPEGKIVVVTRLKETFRNYNGHVEVTNDEIIVEGGLAFARGTYVVTLTPKAGGDSQVVRRRFLEVWRREGHVWRAFRAMDNVGNE